MNLPIHDVPEVYRSPYVGVRTSPPRDIPAIYRSPYGATDASNSGSGCAAAKTIATVSIMGVVLWAAYNFLGLKEAMAQAAPPRSSGSAKLSASSRSETPAKRRGAVEFTPAPNADLAGTSFHRVTIPGTLAQIKKKLGAPHSKFKASDYRDGKYEWIFEGHDDDGSSFVVSVYDHEPEGRAATRWHIGAPSEADARAFRNWFNRH